LKFVKKYRGWRIWLLSVTTPHGIPIYVAVKDDRAVEGVDLPDLEADIDEAEL
jgi:hypothetical protein